MKQEIKNFIQVDSTGTAGAFVGSFCFPASFKGFDGHFPGQPVLPGVCLVQAVLVAAEQAQNRKLKLVEIVLSKFFAVTLPDEKLDVAIKMDENMVRAKISRGGERVAEVRLRVDYA